jgi:hypothetical protein
MGSPRKSETLTRGQNPTHVEPVTFFSWIVGIFFADSGGAKLTVDRQIEHRTVTQPAPSIQPEPDSPDLLGLQRALGANLSACVPGPQIFRTRIIFGMSHSLSPRGPIVARRMVRCCSTRTEERGRKPSVRLQARNGQVDAAVRQKVRQRLAGFGSREPSSYPPDRPETEVDCPSSLDRQSSCAAMATDVPRPAASARR